LRVFWASSIEYRTGMGRAETEAIMTEAMVAKFIIIQVTLGFILNGLSKTPLGLLPETKEVNMNRSE
jgi:hypothetical protein